MKKPWFLLVWCTLCSCAASREPMPLEKRPSDRKSEEHTERTESGERERERPEIREAQTPPPKDHGIFSDLDGQISTSTPPWLVPAPPEVVEFSGVLYQVIDGHIAYRQEVRKPHAHVLTPAPDQTQAQDRDQDGIPDGPDILLGAKKTVKNGDLYKNSYLVLSYPGGDVPRTEGVCTDVVIRALRNAGYDLQSLVADDIKNRPRSYPMVKTPDPNIDHRRVRTLLPYFEHAFTKLVTQKGETYEDFLPGDVVFMNTMGDGQPEHMGIVSDTRGRSGAPLLINNWNEGTRTAEMDLLTKVPITHRFRISTPLKVAQKERGPEALLARQHQSLPTSVKQLLLVTAPLSTSTSGTLRRFERTDEGFSQVGAEIRVRLGRSGLGAGRGIGGPLFTIEEKVEGDGKAPAGVFSLGTAFGRALKAPYRGGYPYRAVGPGDYWVDDPSSSLYNTWQTLKEGTLPPWSAEKLTLYSLAVVVMHNTDGVKPGAGSAIFLHPWKGPQTATVGCTAMDPAELLVILSWLDEKSSPALAQIPGTLFKREGM